MLPNMEASHQARCICRAGRIEFGAIGLYACQPDDLGVVLDLGFDIPFELCGRAADRSKPENASRSFTLRWLIHISANVAADAVPGQVRSRKNPRAPGGCQSALDLTHVITLAGVLCIVFLMRSVS
jgi:hypothetical protein